MASICCGWRANRPDRGSVPSLRATPRRLKESGVGWSEPGPCEPGTASPSPQGHRHPRPSCKFEQSHNLNMSNKRDLLSNPEFTGQSSLTDPVSSMRYPVMTQSLRLARNIAPEAVQQVMDIGIQVKTDFLKLLGKALTHALIGLLSRVSGATSCQPRSTPALSAVGWNRWSSPIEINSIHLRS